MLHKDFDSKAVRKQLRSHLNQQTTAYLLGYLGYKITSMYKFSIRDERTPSASIAKNGSIKDFGSGEHYSDIIALLHSQHGLTLPEATKWAAECLGVYND